MTDIDRIETRLAAWMEGQADLAVRPYDARRIARTATASSRRRGSSWITGSWGLTHGTPVRGRALVLVVLLIVLAIGAVAVGSRLVMLPIALVPADHGTFESTGSMASGREGATATTLPDGRVLVVGGYDAEVWDPTTADFSPAGDLAQPRWRHTATLLPDGTVLVAGGLGLNSGMGSSLVFGAELWDPATLTFVPAGTSAGGHVGSLARSLADGRVLITGGSLANVDLEAAPEVWDPVARSFADGRGLPGADEPAGVPIGDGSILRLKGGSAEVWTPSSQSFRPAGALVASRDSGATTTLLADGRALVVGGRDPNTGMPIAEAETWDPVTETFSVTGNPIQARADHVAALLPDGRVLVAGGTGAPARTAEVFGLR